MLHQLLRFLFRRPSKQSQTTLHTFILEPILTPSGLIDGGDDFQEGISFEGDVTLADFVDEIDFETIDFVKTDFLEQFDSGVFTVGETGKIEIDYLYDGGGYQGELAIFSLEGMEEYTPGSREFILEAARRALGNDPDATGQVVISDATEGAKLGGHYLKEGNFNRGEYNGTTQVTLNPGERFAFMLVPNGTVQQVYDGLDHSNGELAKSLHPLFSLSTANPEDGLSLGQIADVTGDGHTFVMEDMRVDGWTDEDYNDIIFQIKGATGEAIALDEVIDSDLDWRKTELGEDLYEAIIPKVVELPVDPVVETEYIPDELLVKFDADLSDAEVESLAQSYGAKSTERLVPDNPNSDSALEQWRLLKFETDTNVIQIRDEITQEVGVVTSELNSVRVLFDSASSTSVSASASIGITPQWIPNDPNFNQVWALNNTGQFGGKINADINAPEAWEIQRGSRDVVVAVLDTGVDYNHSDLVANMWQNPGEIAGNGIDDDLNGYIDDIYGYDFGNNDSDPMPDNLGWLDFYYGHGTHVAGTIGAVGDNNLGLAGVSPNVNLMALNIRDSQTSKLSVGTISSAIHYAVNNGANIINASFGSDNRSSSTSFYSQLEFDAIDYANQQGVLFVTSAGNYGLDNDSQPVYPGNYNLPNIITVAATDNRDNIWSKSNYGANVVDLGAPGVGILSTLPNNQYGNAAGTSMAAPHVAGAAALLLAENPNLSASALKNILLSSGRNLTDLENKTVTGKRLDVFNALETIDINLQWVEQFGTTGIDASLDIAVDGNSNIYLAGETSGQLEADNAGGRDAFIRKYDRNRNILWTEQIGTGDDERIEKIAVDNSGNLYVTGWTFGDLEGNGSGDIEGWVAKYAPNGNQVWIQQLNYIVTAFYDLAVDDQGNVYVIGEHSYGNVQTDSVVLKYDREGNLQWSNQYTANRHDIGRGIAVDAIGNVYATGWSQSGFDRNPLSPTNAGVVESWLLKINPNGQREWVKTTDYNSDTRATDVVLDSLGNMYVTGYTKADINGNNAGSWDAWLAKYDPNGQQVWIERFASGSSDVAWEINIDRDDYLYITGTTAGELAGTKQGSGDNWVAKYDRDGNRIWQHQMGTAGNDVTFGMTTDNQNNLYMTGYTFGNFGVTNQGSADVWFAKYS